MIWQDIGLVVGGFLLGGFIQYRFGGNK